MSGKNATGTLCRVSDAQNGPFVSYDPADPESLRLARIDTTRPHPARIYDFLLGGKDNFQVDRDAAEKVVAAVPTARAEVTANREFLRRAVAYAAGQGISQFLDIGTGIPTVGPTHEVAQQVNPQARVAYVDNDPIVLAHSRALLTTNDRTLTVQADVREPDTILRHPAVRELLDFEQPIALMFVGLLYFVDDAEDPWSLVARYRDALTPGSHLLLSHIIDTAETRTAAKVYETATSGLSPRGPEQISAMFDGWEVVEPGIVPIHDWRPAGGETFASQLLGGVGRLT
jgi:SAM-dependent methyltransferase